MSPISQYYSLVKPPPEEDPYVLEKREKARDRQRRKRARDKSASALASYLDSHPDADVDPKERERAMQASGINKMVGNGKGVDLDALPPGEAARREKIRVAARERQRRHRAGVKAKRMAELGMAIVNAGGVVEQTAIGYTINASGQYEAVLADANQSDQPPQLLPYPVPHLQHATPGQTFSSTLFLALSFAPLLKQNLLRTLRFTNEELSAFEPVLAAAFDHWDHGRAMYYAAHGYHANSSSYLPPTTIPYDLRDRSYRSVVQRDADDSMSVSDDESHMDDDEQGRAQSDQPEAEQDREDGEEQRTREREEGDEKQETDEEKQEQE